MLAPTLSKETYKPILSIVEKEMIMRTISLTALTVLAKASIAEIRQIAVFLLVGLASNTQECFNISSA